MKRNVMLCVLFIVLAFTGCSAQVEYPFMQSEENIAATILFMQIPTVTRRITVQLRLLLQLIKNSGSVFSQILKRSPASNILTTRYRVSAAT